jgi:2,4-dienoyl-CoA reductase-like NADH-dependent reductase (Old Yellow Enzyme family)
MWKRRYYRKKEVGMSESNATNEAAEIDLFQPMAFGRLTLKNRIAMAPLTRSRANEGGTPSELQTTYYAQRASAGHFHTSPGIVS